MTSAIRVGTFNVVEDSGVTLMARIYNAAGDAIKQADLSTITYASYVDSTAAAVTGGSGSITIADTIFDSLQTDDPRWDGTPEGFNFAFAAPVTIVPDGDVTYQVEVTFTPTSGAVFIVLWKLHTLPVHGS